MLNLQIISTIIGFFAGLGIMAAGCGYAYSSWKAGKNKYKDELITDLKATVAVKESEIIRLNQEKTVLITSHQAQLTKLQTELSELKGAFAEQSKKLEEYRAIFENRDPQTLETLMNIKKGIDSLNEHQVKSEKQTKRVAKTLLRSK